MPDMVPTYSNSSYSVTLKDVAGKKARISISGYSASVTGVDLTLFRTAASKLSNAGAITTNQTLEAGINEANADAFDEGESSVTTKAVFVFQDSTRVTKRIEIPAPDASIFNEDGVTVNTAFPLVAAFLTRALNILNASTPPETFQLLRAFASERSRRTRTPNFRPNIVEPGTGSSPPPAPGA